MAIYKAKVDTLFNIINYTLLTLIMVAAVYPIYFMLIASISDPVAVRNGEVILMPARLTMEGYLKIFADHRILRGYGNTIILSLLGTLINIALLLPAAFALSRKELRGKKILTLAITFTMYFNGGLLPTYLIVKNLNLINSVWSLILPGAVVTYNLIVTRSFFQSNIPEELWEAASMDGCSYTRFFFVIVLPVSKAILSVMILFHAVGYWNAYFSAMIYLNDEAKFPLQLILRSLLIESQAMALADDVYALAEKSKIAELIKYGVVIVSSLPVLLIYPFIQKYFVQGVMIGSVKG